jgi:hypothetical protein
MNDQVRQRSVTGLRPSIIVPLFESNVCFGGGGEIILLFSSKEYSPPPGSSGQSSWLQIQRSRIISAALPNLLRSSRSGMGSTQNLRIIEELLERKVGIRCSDHTKPSTSQNLALTLLTSGGRSVGIVHLQIGSLGV